MALEHDALRLSALNQLSRMEKEHVFVIVSSSCPHCQRFSESGQEKRLKRALSKKGYTVINMDALDDTRARTMLRAANYTKVPALLARKAIVRNMCHDANETLFACSANHENLLPALSTGPNSGEPPPLGVASPAASPPSSPKIVVRRLQALS